MFKNTLVFNQDLSAWNLSSVEIVREMFHAAQSFNQDLCAWGSFIAKDRTWGPTIADDVFAFSGCAHTGDPNISQAIPGPLCHVCSAEDDN